MKKSRWLNEGGPILIVIILFIIVWYGGIVPKYETYKYNEKLTLVKDEYNN